MARLIGSARVSGGQAADGRLSGCPFVPRLLPAPDKDAALVPLAGKQDGVARAGSTDRVSNALTTIDDPFVIRPLRPAHFLGTGGDLAEDGHGILLPRVFIGEDGVVAEAGGDLPHPGSLLAIAVTGAPEDGDQPPLRDRPQLTKDLLETLRRVRVIDDHGERLTEVDSLHPAADPAVAF